MQARTVARAGKQKKSRWLPAAAMKGSSHVISGAANKLQAAGSHLLSPDALAEQHRKMAEPGTAE